MLVYQRVSHDFSSIFFQVWVTGVLVVWILEPLGYPIDFLRRLAALRVLRLGRLARAVRIMPMFHEPRGEKTGWVWWSKTESFNGI